MTIRPLAKLGRYAKRERVDYTKFELAKNPPKADAKYRAFAKSLGCQIAGKVDLKTGERHICGPRVNGKPVIEFAHGPVKRGMSKKASDFGNGMGLCYVGHEFVQHTIGWVQFAKRYEINPIAICADIADRFEAKFGRRGK